LYVVLTPVECGISLNHVCLFIEIIVIVGHYIFSEMSVSEVDMVAVVTAKVYKCVQEWRKSMSKA
jgi:hypothetical protein